MWNTSIKISSALIFMMMATLARADTVINNYGTNNSQPQEQAQNQQSQQNQESNNIDPRIPPAGSYSTSNADGSSEQLYTTGQKQPFYVDNPQQNQPQPQVFVQPTMPTPTPTPTPPLKR